MTQLTLHTPSNKELSYRGHLISDEETMSYNMGYGDNGGCTYHKTAEELCEWYQYWKTPDRFYAYIQRKEELAFIGEVNLHKSEKNNWFEMGIIIEAKYRGMGYSVPALNLLLEHAFTKMNAKAVHNYFEDNRKAAINLHLKAGFIQTGHKNGMVDFLITKEQYERFKANFCYCGHDCARCITYIATQQNDNNLRRQSQSFYKEKFGLDIPLEKFNCNGGRSDKVFEPCKECPFIKCCKQHDVDSCSKCPEYPCKEISDYQAKYVNKCNQI